MGYTRIHGELLKLGYNSSQSTVYRYLQNLRRNQRSQNWKTFLRNHSKEILSMDFLTVPTINLKKAICLFNYLTPQKKSNSL